VKVGSWVFFVAAVVSALWFGLLAWASLGRCDWRYLGMSSPSQAQSVTSFHADIHSIELMHSWKTGAAIPAPVHVGWAMLGVRRATLCIPHGDGSVVFITTVAATAPQMAMLPLAAVLPALATTRGVRRWGRQRRERRQRVVKINPAPLPDDAADANAPIY
jgi:hypothetical protein